MRSTAAAHTYRSHRPGFAAGIALLNGVTGAVDTFSSQAHGSRTFPAIGAPARMRRLLLPVRPVLHGGLSGLFCCTACLPSGRSGLSLALVRVFSGQKPLHTSPPHPAGVVLQRALLLALLTCVPLMLLYWQALPVLLVLGQERALAAAAARYTRIFAGKVPLHAVALCLYRTLAAQGAAAHVLAASVVYCGVTAPINWALISWLGWGLDGSAAAAVACEAGGPCRHMPCLAIDQPCHAMPCRHHAMPCQILFAADLVHPCPLDAMQCTWRRLLPPARCTMRGSRRASGGGTAGASMHFEIGARLPGSACHPPS